MNFNYIDPPLKKKESFSNKILVKIQSTTHSKESGKAKNKKNLKSISFSQLGVGNISPTIGKIGKTSLSREFNLYAHINQFVSYPEYLVKRGIEGHLHVEAIINNNGLKRLVINTHHPLLRVYVASLLETSLEKEFLKEHYSEKYIKLPMIFHFELSTNLNKSPPPTDKILYFYRLRYGGDTGSEKIANYSATTLTYLTNWLMLLKHRPDFMRTKKDLMNRIIKKNKLTNLKDHHFFSQSRKEY